MYGYYDESNEPLNLLTIGGVPNLAQVLGHSTQVVTEVTGAEGWTYASYDSNTGEHKFIQGNGNPKNIPPTVTPNRSANEL